MTGSASSSTLKDRVLSIVLPARIASSLSDAAAVGAPATGAKLSWSRRPVIREAIGMWAATRVAYAVMTYLAVTLSTSVRAASGSHVGYALGYLPHAGHEFVDVWMRWDAIWYVNIAQHGYFESQATAFFPLLPGLIKLISLIIGPHWALAGLIAGNLGSLVAFIGVALLAAGETNKVTGGLRAVRLFAAYPLAFFLAAPYTDGLFLGLAALALYCARRGNWKWAAGWAFLAGLTRPTGVILILPLVWEFGRQNGWWRRTTWRTLRDTASGRGRWAAVRSWMRALLSPGDTGRIRILNGVLLVAAVPLAIGLFGLLCWVSVGHFLIFLHAQQIYWNRVDAPIWKTLGSSAKLFVTLPRFSFWQMRLLVDLGPLLLFGVLTLVAIRRLPFAFTLYMVGLLYLTVASPVVRPLEPDPIFSAGRFLLAATPMFVLLARWTEGRPWLDTLFLACGFTAQALLGVYFLIGGWMV